MKRVLIISYYWPPSGGAGVQRWLKFSKFLPKYGWEPIILTVDPQTASYPVTDSSLGEQLSPDLRIIRTRSKESFSFYKKVSGSSKIPYAGFANDTNSVSFKEKAARFVRGNFFLPDPRKGWNKYAQKAAMELIQKEKIHCIISTGPPHSSHFIGKKLQLLTNIPWIADFRDPWTDIYYYRKFYPTFVAHRINLRMEKDILVSSTKILTVSKGFKELFVKKECISPEKISIIPNGFDPFDLPSTMQSQTGCFNITYVGTLADTYPMDTFISCMDELSRVHKDINLRFIGSISGAQKEKLDAIKELKVEYINYVEHSMALVYMKQANVLLLVIPESSEGNGILPGKIFEYLAAERPILGIGPEKGDSARILLETGAGKMLSSNNKTEMQNTIMNYYKAYKNKQDFVSDKSYLRYSRENLSKELSDLLNSSI